jgi:hypothetical protein
LESIKYDARESKLGLEMPREATVVLVRTCPSSPETTRYASSAALAGPHSSIGASPREANGGLRRQELRLRRATST